MKFCPACGAPVELRKPQDDHRERYVCTACATIHYQNPRMIVGTIPEWSDGRILLCLRAIEPRRGLWTLPAGFMENDETTWQGAARETLEEANARVQVHELYGLYNLAYINQVHLLFRATLLDLDFSPGIESLEVKLFSEAEIPWEQLAFRPVRATLEHFFADRKRGQFTLHGGDLAPPARAR
ncbi:NUDIX hydrolase [Ferrigenium sp. UT5]|uniref:NUDIX hydrolase n=1 Tax=Ferrigenium sp. UT5 TaxID=3242105 RepID=UPI00354E51A3